VKEEAMETLLIIIIAIVALLVVTGAVVVFAMQNDKKRRDLREGFGPEYHQTLSRTGSRSEAERELKERQKRVSSFDLKPLMSADAARFSDEWRRTQERFVDDPKAAIGDADRLVQDVMKARGYPMSDFDQRAADVSVDYPEVVQNYRQGHRVAQANERGEANTEDLRQAVIHYRALFVELLETEDATAETAARR
jgi:hypothetical protein